MGTRDALLQIQMGTYANGVTCYYTFPYTNNVLIGPTPYVRRVWGAGPPVSTLSLSRSFPSTSFSLALPLTTRAGSSAASAERISDIRAVETDLSIVPPLAFHSIVPLNWNAPGRKGKIPSSSSQPVFSLREVLFPEIAPLMNSYRV